MKDKTKSRQKGKNDATIFACPRICLISIKVSIKFVESQT